MKIHKPTKADFAFAGFRTEVLVAKATGVFVELHEFELMTGSWSEAAVLFATKEVPEAYEKLRHKIAHRRF